MVAAEQFSLYWAMQQKKIISHKVIDRAIAELDSMNERQVESLIKDFGDKQPALTVYIMSHESSYSENDFDLLVNMALLVYHCFRLEFASMRSIQIDEVEAYEQKQEDDLIRMERMTDSEMEAEMARTVHSAKQPFLLEFITESLAVREDSDEIEDESGGAAFFSPLQLLIEMLDSAGNGSFLKIV